MFYIAIDVDRFGFELANKIITLIRESSENINKKHVILSKMIAAKTAYLILAHHQPAHLTKLVKAISCDWASVFIHIDAKADIFQFKKLISEDKNIIFLKENQQSGARLYLPESANRLVASPSSRT